MRFEITSIIQIEVGYNGPSYSSGTLKKNFKMASLGIARKNNLFPQYPTRKFNIYFFNYSRTVKKNLIK